MRADERFKRQFDNALTELGAVRTFELIADAMLDRAQSEGILAEFRSAYLDGVDDLARVIKRFEDIRKTFNPVEQP